MEFNTIAISDGETMGTEGMKASLVSREVIADSIELVCRGQLFDAMVCVVGCDKTIPAAAMAMARLDLPGLVLYGGTIAAGNYRGKEVTIQDVFEAVGANAAGKISDADLLDAGLQLASEEGLFVAPEGAACVSAIERLLASGFLKRHEKIVIYNTGAGLKYLEAYATRFPRSAAGEQDKLGGLITPR